MRVADINWLDQGFITLEFSSIKIMLVVFETSSNEYTLVNLGFGGRVTIEKTILINLNEITC
jgi:iron complex outermembrane receptor protein